MENYSNSPTIFTVRKFIDFTTELQLDGLINSYKSSRYKFDYAIRYFFTVTDIT